MNPKDPKKRKKYPCNGVVDSPCTEPKIRLSVHGGDEKEINNPADQEETECKEPNGPGDGLSVIANIFWIELFHFVQLSILPSR